MNKEIIHQAAQAHAEKSFIQPLNAQEVMSIPTGHTVPYGYRALQIG
jgi:GDP-D-mannose dehydratase